MNETNNNIVNNVENNQKMNNTNQLNNRNNKKSNNVLIICVTIILLAIIAAVVVIFLNSKKDSNSNKTTNDQTVNNNTNNQEDKTYKEYQKGDEIVLGDGTKYYVIADSGKSQDYVTIISQTELKVEEPDYTKISNDYYASNGKVSYDNSSIKKFVESQKEKYPVEYKNVNGYDIRLITLDELLSLDKWELGENDTYKIESKNTKFSVLSNVMTMTPSKCTEGKCASFYALHSDYCTDDSCIPKYYIGVWSLGLPTIHPVLNVLKTSLK